MLNIGRNLIKFGQNATANSNINMQQVRTTFVLKRRWEAPLSKKGHRPRMLRSKHFVYDVVEDANLRKQPNLNLVLTAYVEGLGVKGDEVSVKPTFAYHKLLLPGLAVYASPESRRKFGEVPPEASEEVQHSSPFAERTVNVLSRLCVDVTLSKDEPWTLQPWHVRVSLRKAGVHVADDSAIELPPTEIRGPDLALENKEFLVKITVNNLEKVDVRCRLHHWSTKPSERLPRQIEPWCQPSEPIFPHQADLLAGMPLPRSKITPEEERQLH